MTSRMSDTSIEARLRGYIVSNFLLAPGAEPMRDASLLNEGIIDSTGYLELFSWLKDEFGIRVEPDEMGTENFETVANIAAYIERKLAAQGASAR
jgi:acyl carrier protein